MSDAETGQRTLQQWARDQQLASAKLSDDGASITLGDNSISATTILNVSHADKSCSYSAASIYLQLLDPDQGLLAYRNACKKYNVSDPVKALDKPVILGYFLGVSTGLASEAPAVPTNEVAAEAPHTDTAASSAPADAEARSKTSDPNAARSKEHRKSSGSKRKEPSSSSKQRKDDHHRHHKSSSSKHHHAKQPKTLVTNEQLFDSLNYVVDKRQVADFLHKQQEEITRALSADGFQVTPELLEEHKEKAQLIMSKEIPVGNSASILRAANPKKDLSRVLELFNEATKPTKGPGSQQNAANSSNGGSGSKKPGSPVPPTGSGGKVIRKHLLGKKPIIIVPKGMTAPITIINAHDFLANAKYVPRDVVMKQNRHKNPSTNFTRSVRGATGVTGLLEYEIVDNPRKLGVNPNEWDRVVAVIALGQSWQFKDWFTGYNEPAQLFDRVYGYFVCLEGDKIPAEIPRWSVHQSRLNRDKRGLDQVAYASFWNGLDEWMRVRKPELLPQAEMS